MAGFDWRLLALALSLAACAQCMPSDNSMFGGAGPQDILYAAEPSGGLRRLQQSFLTGCERTCRRATSKLPVCTQTNHTYDNACQASCQISAIAYYGACHDEPCLCPGTWAPVCGGGKSYANSCFAACKKVTKTTPGLCKPDCQAPTTSAPVCGFDGKQYNNVALATCAGMSVAYSGKCDIKINTCKCPSSFSPVCVSANQTVFLPAIGTTVVREVNTTYDSPCLGKCLSGNKPSTPGFCPDYTLWNANSWWCGCPNTIKPVCATYTPTNTTSTLASACVATCLGYTVKSQGICKDECICPGATDPVCVTSGKTKITYRNACEARCRGKATTWTKGSCTPCTACPDPTFSSYICGTDGINYANSCLASCVGVGVRKAGFCGST